MVFAKQPLPLLNRIQQAKQLSLDLELITASPRVSLLQQVATAFVASPRSFLQGKQSGVAPTSPSQPHLLSQEPGNPSAEAPDRSTPLAGCFTQQTRAEPHPWSSPLTACAPAHSPPTNPTADQPRPTPQQEPTTASPRLFLQAPAPTAFVAGHS